MNLQWAAKAVETLLGNDAFRYLSICSILFASSVNSLIPPAPNSMLCRRCGLCSRRNRKINIVLRGRETNMTKTLKNRILLPSVSTLLSPIVCNRKLAFAKITGVVLHWNVYHRFIPRFGSFSCQNYGKLILQYKNLRKYHLFWKCNLVWHSCVTSPI